MHSEEMNQNVILLQKLKSIMLNHNYIIKLNNTFEPDRAIVPKFSISSSFVSPIPVS